MCCSHFTSIQDYRRNISLYFDKCEFQNKISISRLLTIQNVIELHFMDCEIKSISTFDPNMSRIRNLIIDNDFKSFDIESINQIVSIKTLSELTLQCCFCSHQLQTSNQFKLLDLRWNYFTGDNISILLEQNVEKLLLYNNRITHINVDSKKVTLLFLDLSLNRLTQSALITIFAFPKLKSLILQNCSLTEIPRELNNSTIIHLDLMGNRLDPESVSIVLHCQSLKEVLLQQCSISDLQQVDPTVVKVSMLDISGNPLNQTSIDIIMQFPELSDLNVKKCQLYKFQTHLITSKIKKLKMSGCTINSCDELAVLISSETIEELDISKMQISDFPRIKEVGNIKKLIMNQNEFDDVLQTMQQLAKLMLLPNFEELHMMNCKLQLCPTIPFLSKIKILNISKSDFALLNNFECIFHSSSLTELNISYCNLKQLIFDPEQCQIAILHVNNNKLDQESMQLIANLPKLRKINANMCTEAVQLDNITLIDFLNNPELQNLCITIQHELENIDQVLQYAALSNICELEIVCSEERQTYETWTKFCLRLPKLKQLAFNGIDLTVREGGDIIQYLTVADQEVDVDVLCGWIELRNVRPIKQLLKHKLNHALASNDAQNEQTQKIITLFAHMVGLLKAIEVGKFQ